MPELASAPPETVRGALREATARLARADCETPRLDAELLLAELLGLDRGGLVMEAHRELSPRQQAGFRALVERREAREPVAYITGRRWFRDLELAVDRRVLIPRPETELLVEAALGLPGGTRVVDVGTGSGAVALALAAERPDLAVTGVDVCPAAVEVARGNAARLALDVKFLAGDLLGPCAREAEAVVANLPYVAEGERAALAPEILEFEPPGALFAGEDGLAAIRRLVGALGEPVRFVALEVGAGQAAAVEALLRAAGFGGCERRRDLGGHERVVVGRCA